MLSRAFYPRELSDALLSAIEAGRDPPPRRSPILSVAGARMQRRLGCVAERIKAAEIACRGHRPILPRKPPLRLLFIVRASTVTQAAVLRRPEHVDRN